MKKSSNMLPFWIILVLVFVVASAMLLKTTSLSGLQSYDVFGLSSMKTGGFLGGNRDNQTDSEPNTEGSDYGYSLLPEEDEVDPVVSEPSDPSEDAEPEFESDGSAESDEVDIEDNAIAEPELTPVPPIQTEQVPAQPDNLKENVAPVVTQAPAVNTEPVPADTTKPGITPIEFNKPLYRAGSRGKETDKFEFFTLNTDSDYRVLLKTNISDNPVRSEVTVSVYNERGIMVDTATARGSMDSERYADFHLDKSQKYTLKISSSFLSGDYQITLLQLDRDAGHNSESAIPISVGEEITATMNSSLSDWYVFTVEEDCRYELTIHNIDTGRTLSTTGTKRENMSVFSRSTQNESSTTSKFFATSNEKIYIEVRPNQADVNGTYIMILNKEVQ